MLNNGSISLVTPTLFILHKDKIQGNRFSTAKKKLQNYGQIQPKTCRAEHKMLRDEVLTGHK